MPDALLDQGMLGQAGQALMQRKKMLLAQEALAMGQNPEAQPMPIQPPGMQAPTAQSMDQAQFSGYAPGQQRMTPMQAQQLARLLQARQQ